MFIFIDFINKIIYELVNNRGIERKKILIFLDNCPSHVSNYAIFLLQNLAVKILFNTQCTPAFNIIEGIFADLKL